MALGEGGLDAQVEQRMDAYRGNPQQLQKRYGQNKELLDLLALQKLTAEKKQVAADMQLKAQQNPNTIAQQREQEALELVKGEMGGTLGELTGRTASTLGQKQKMQQKNMQRMAKGASRPPAGISGLPGLSGRPQARPPMPPQAQGLAGARMAQAAAQQGGPRRMAQGGIVGFSNGEEVGSPFGRGVRKFLGDLPEDMRLQQLQQKIRTKYGLFASAFGGLRSQSDEQRAYAKNVLAQIDANNLSEEQLTALDNATFTSGMSAEALSALPELPVSDSSEEITETETEVDGGPPEADDNQDLDITNIGNVGREPTDFFANVETEYTPATVPEVDTSRLTTATDAMVAGAQKTPTRQTVDDLKAAPLEFVEAPYDETGKEMLGELTTQYRADAKIDPINALDAARVSSDDYFGRADKAAIYDQQEADLRALQAETLDPDRLAKLARMRTLAGGRYGAGGIGSEYVEAELAKDKRRNEGLKSLRGIQDTGVLTDTGIATSGAASGENAATRAENRRLAGVSGMQGLLANQDRRAEQGQVEANKINIANFNYKTAISENDFKVAAGAIRDQNASLRTIVELEQNTINNSVKTNLQNTKEENEARKSRIEQQLEKAIAQQDAEHENNKLLMESETELTKLLEAREKNVRETVALAMLEDPLALQIQDKLNKLVKKGETGPQVKKLVDELNALKEQFTMTLIETVDGFGNNYARMTALRRRIAQLQQANSMLGSTLSERDDEISVEQIIGPQ